VLTRGDVLRSRQGYHVDLNERFFGVGGTLSTTGDDGVAVAWNPAMGTGPSLPAVKADFPGKVFHRRTAATAALPK
jgi:hypothetical protein